MICPKCGKTYGTKNTYCISCGALLTEDSADNAPDSAADTSSNTASEPKSITVTPTGFESAADISQREGYPVRSISMTSAADKPIHKKVGRQVAKNAASLVLSVLLFASAGLFFVSSIGRTATDSANAEKAVRCMDILSIPASELRITSLDGAKLPENTTLSEAILLMTEGSGVDESNIRRIYDRSTAKEFIGNAAADYADFIRSGKKPEEITAERLKSLLGENISVISSNTGVPLSDSDIELAYEQIELSESALANLSAARLEQGRSGAVLKAVRAFLSVPILISELVFSAAAAAAIAIINKSTEKSMRCCGIPVFLAGFCAALLTFMFSMQLGIFGNLNGLEKETAAGISKAVSQSAYQLSAMMMFVGLCLMITSRSLSKKESF